MTDPMVVLTLISLTNPAAFGCIVRQTVPKIPKRLQLFPTVFIQKSTLVSYVFLASPFLDVRSTPNATQRDHDAIRNGPGLKRVQLYSQP